MPLSDASENPSALLSVVLPCYNEQAVLPKTHARFSAMEQAFAQWGLDYELIFVNDGSRDNTPEMLNELAGRDRHVRAVHLARNFGHQAAVSAGLTVAPGGGGAGLGLGLPGAPGNFSPIPPPMARGRC